MKNLAGPTFAALAAIAALGAGQAVAGEAGTSGCVGVVFNQEFLRNFPQAPAACQSVVTRDGVKKIHFQARVTDVSRDVVTLDFLNAFNNPVTGGRPLVFTPPADLDLTVNGSKIKASQLKRDDVLDFWVPENLLGFHADPDANALISFTLQ